MREKAHPARSREGDAGNSTPPAAFRHFRALSGPEKTPRERAASITGAIAPVMLAARESVLSNTHGSVDFPRSPSRLASPVTFPWDSRASRVANPSRIRHSHRPALSAAATACQGRRREGSVPFPGASFPRPRPFPPRTPLGANSACTAPLVSTERLKGTLRRTWVGVYVQGEGWGHPMTNRSLRCRRPRTSATFW